MRPVNEIYDNEKKEEWQSEFDEYDYVPMLKEIGNIVLQVDEDDYQGDSWVLYDNDEKIGYLNFGWGSCSGCDALQACTTISEAQSLFDDLMSSVKWFGNIDEAIEYFESDARRMDYAWSYQDFRDFVHKSTAYLKEKKDETVRNSN
jgi:hypothetical protein